MSNRLTKIYTKQGDKGLTRLANGERVAKSHPRIQAIGEVDMLNSQLGLLLAALKQETTDNSNLQELIDQLLPCLHRLFDVGGELAMPEYQAISDEHTHYLEQLIDHWNEQLGPLKDFILPTGSMAASQAHICRCQARTSERVCQTLHQTDPIRNQLLAYLNRISDLFFVCARMINHNQKIAETLWQSANKPT